MALDRIDGLRPSDTGANTARIKGADTKGGAEGFTLLRDEMEGVIYEPESTGRPEKPRTLAQVREEIAREESEAARANLHSRFDGPGVTVELSAEGVKAERQPQNASILDIFRNIWQSIVGFFSNIWNGGQEPTEAQEIPEEIGEQSDQAAQLSTESSENVPADMSPGSEEVGAKAASPLERSNTPEAVAAFMVDYGGARLAKNSDLLTQYDRSGHIVTMDPSDKRRILHSKSVIRNY